MTKNTQPNITFQDYEDGSIRKEVNESVKKHRAKNPKQQPMTASHMMRVAIIEGLKVVRKKYGIK